MQIEFGGDFFQRWHFVEAKAVEISLLLGSEEGLTLESSAFLKICNSHFHSFIIL